MLAAFVGKRLSMRGVNTGSPKVAEDAVQFAKANDVKPVIEKFPLDKAQEAYERRNTAKFRAVLIP